MSQSLHDEPARVRAAAERFRREIVDDAVAQRAKLEDPIPVRGRAGEIDSWFVALTTEDRLLGFFQFERDLRLHRYSTFQRTPDSTSDCPVAATWLDRAAIRERARTVIAEGDQLEEPILSYLGNRDRLAWRVRVANSRRSVYVIGDDVHMGTA